ncbi:PAS domain-containing sensor histidine kinase [Aeromicrobium sp. IC_218]|nr:PAS domain-containing sensor histidine kinase [Aeromicrobium sp. IC_218]
MTASTGGVHGVTEVDLDELPDGLIVAGPDGRVEYVNGFVRQLARAKGDEMLGMHLADALPFDDLNGHSWFECVDPYGGLATRTRISEQSWWSPRGSEYLITARLVREKPLGPVVRLVVSVRNARIRNQRDRERSDLIATVAHELRSPLTGIKGFVSTLLTKWDRFSDEQKQFMLATVDADADRLTRLITELLDAARIDSGRLTLRRGPVQLDELAARVVDSVFVASGWDGEVEVTGEVPVVWGDADRITQVLTNLVENAVRHGKGLRGLAVRPEVHAGEQGVRVLVRDAGPGIPEESRMRIFSRFWRSGPGAGTGLGMYIVRGIVDQHGGHIDVEDADGGGAEISFWLPVAEPAELHD